MTNLGTRTFTAWLCLFISCAGSARAGAGFGPGQTLDAGKASAEAREGEVPKAAPAYAVPAGEPGASPGWGKEFPVSGMSPYAAVRCKDGAGIAARATGEAKQFFSVAAAPFFPGGTVLTGVKFSIDEDFGLRLGTERIRLGKLKFETACSPWHTDREIQTYVPAALDADPAAWLAVRLDGPCRSASNWPNGPGRNYWRNTLIVLSVPQSGGRPYRLEVPDTWAFPDRASCEAGQFIAPRP